MDAIALFFVFFFLILSSWLSAFIDTFRLPFIHFSAIAIVLGFAFGGLVRVAHPSMDSIRFEDNIFFHAVLPVIVFAAGYSLDVKTFLSNLREIVSLGVVGTLLLWLGLGFSAMLLRDIGMARSSLSDMECLLLAAVLASTDTVAVVALLEPEAAPVLYSVLAGEGMVNDGVSVVLFRAVTNIVEEGEEGAGLDGPLVGRLIGQFSKVLVLSILMGVAVGLVSALSAKWNRERPTPDIEVSLVLLWGFCAYYLAEMVDCSGIISVFVCGMVMSQYTVWNISATAQFTSFHALNSLSFLMQALIFTALGFFVWGYIADDVLFSDVDGAGSDVTLSVGMFVAVGVCRAVLVPVTLALLGLCQPKKKKRFSAAEQVAIWYGGTVRGVIAFALCQSIQTPRRDSIVTATFIMVMFTSLFGGCGTKPLFKLLGIPTSVEEGGAQPADRATPPHPLLSTRASVYGLDASPARRLSSLSAARFSVRRPPAIAAPVDPHHSFLLRSFTADQLAQAVHEPQGAPPRSSYPGMFVCEEGESDDEAPRGALHRASRATKRALRKFDEKVMQPLFGKKQSANGSATPLRNPFLPPPAPSEATEATRLLAARAKAPLPSPSPAASPLAPPPPA